MRIDQLGMGELQMQILRLGDLAGTPDAVAIDQTVPVRDVYASTSRPGVKPINEERVRAMY
jgi:hypothetical protein